MSDNIIRSARTYTAARTLYGGAKLAANLFSAWRHPKQKQASSSSSHRPDPPSPPKRRLWSWRQQEAFDRRDELRGRTAAAPPPGRPGDMDWNGVPPVAREAIINGMSSRFATPYERLVATGDYRYPGTRYFVCSKNTLEIIGIILLWHDFYLGHIDYLTGF